MINGIAQNKREECNYGSCCCRKNGGCQIFKYVGVLCCKMVVDHKIIVNDKTGSDDEAGKNASVYGNAQGRQDGNSKIKGYGYACGKYNTCCEARNE